MERERERDREIERERGSARERERERDRERKGRRHDVWRNYHDTPYVITLPCSLILSCAHSFSTLGLRRRKQACAAPQRAFAHDRISEKTSPRRRDERHHLALRSRSHNAMQPEKDHLPQHSPEESPPMRRRPGTDKNHCR